MRLPSVFLSLLLFFFFFLHHQSFTHALTLKDACEGVQYFGTDKDFCLTSLQVDPKSLTATSEELAIISTGLSQRNATSTYRKMEALLKNTTDQKLKKYLTICSDFYAKAIVDLKNVFPLIRAKAYNRASTLIFQAALKRHGCDLALGEGDEDPVLKENKDLAELLDVRPLLPLAFKRSFSVDIKQFPSITDPEVEAAFKDLMAANWDEIPEGVVYDVKAALSKPTEDKAGQEALANVFRAAEASEEFGGVLVSLRMTLDDKSGMTGQNVATLPTELEDALKAVYNRYTAYLDAFGHDETYLRKKVEMELGTKMVHLKMRCSGLGSEWGKITVLGTSGLSGSYLEQRA